MKGQCLCGEVTVEISAEDTKISVCHCSMCRTWAGGPFFAIHAQAAPKLTGEASLGIYPSSEWAERVFCKTCGSHLFYRLKDGSFHGVSSGLFAPENLSVKQQIFIDEKPDYYALRNDTPTLTGEQVFAAFSQD